MLVAFLVFVLCTVAFSADYYSIVQVDNKATPDTVFQQGDTLNISANLSYGENFIEWTIESGSGTFLYSYLPTTKFVPTSPNVVLKKTTKKIANAYNVFSETFTEHYVYSEAIYTSDNLYGFVGKYTTTEAGLYSIHLGFKGKIMYPKYSTDSLFSTKSTTSYDQKRFTFTAQANTTYYILVKRPDYTDTKDTVSINIGKAHSLNLLVQGPGKATLDSSAQKVSSYSKFILNDSIPITATINPNGNFVRWEKVSGSCSIVNSKDLASAIIMGNDDCNIRAVFSEGIIYDITKTPTKYSVTENLYSTNAVTKTQDVRFHFTPESRETYYIYTSKDPLTDDLRYRRAVRDNFDTLYKNRVVSGTFIDTVLVSYINTPMNILVYRKNNNDQQEPFWISYGLAAEAKYSLKISSDPQGTPVPTSYTSVNTGVKLSIGAKANEGYRFLKWQVVSGNVTIDDPSSPFTYATLGGDAEVKALYQNTNIYTLSFIDQTFNFKDNYYNENTASEVRFTWTPPDTGYYAVVFTPIDSIVGTSMDYGSDSTFKEGTKQKTIGGINSFIINGNANEPLFLGYKDSIGGINSKNFKVRLDSARILEITSNNSGSTHPNGKTHVAPYSTSIITAWPYGGYVFDSWNMNSGNCTIEDSKKAITNIAIRDSSCSLKANFVIDITAQPNIKIDNVDLGNYPGICAQVSVTDQNNRSINGLLSKDFILFEDDVALTAQVSRINEVSAISTVLVIDQSGSMTYEQRIPKTKEALKNFINEMGPFDRASIVAFAGTDTTYVHQEMTSDKELLLASLEKIKGGGNTNVFAGTYTALQQTINEINPTAVIVFSDGENNRDSKTMEQVLEVARAQNVSIYTIGLETTIEHPLRDLADSTGGTFTFAKDASELAGIYAAVRDNMQAKYMLCYQTPDTLLNGEIHEIKISTSLLGKEATDTTTWQENFMPPTITLTDSTWDKIINTQPPQIAIPIQVYITTSSPVVTANINIRHTSRLATSFQSYPLKNVHDSLWEYVVPADSATSPGIDFYVTVTDSAGFIGKSPKIPSPSKEPYTIAIDNDLPKASLLSATCADSTKGTKTFTITASDNDGIWKVGFYYKEREDVLFKETFFRRHSNTDSTWYLNIPSDASTSSGIDFYIRVFDIKGTVARWESSGFMSTEPCYVKTIFEDVPDTIKIVNADTAASPITRSTDKIKLIVKTEDFSTETDTIIANLRCIESGDIESQIFLVEKSEGTFEATISKDEHLPRRDNGTISCSGSDVLVAEYKDPAFGTYTYDSVSIVNFVAITYKFLDVFQETDIDSVETTTNAEFRLRVTATSENIHKVDTVAVTLFTATGDTLNVKAVETDTNSAQFDYVGKFYFVADSSEMKPENLDGILLFSSDVIREKIQAQAALDTSPLTARDSLVVFTNYVPADSAEIYDKNLDGEADFVRIHFKKPLNQNVQSVDTLFWNVGHKDPHYVTTETIQMTSDKSWVEFDLDSTFEYGKTVPDSANPPYLRVTKAGSNLSQKVPFTDKIGAVPVKAVKRPGKAEANEYLSVDVLIPPDTLVVTLSEKITRTGDEKEWENIFRYSKTCADTSSSPIKFKGAPKISLDGLEWTMILDDVAVIAGTCLEMNPGAAYTDIFGNSLGRGNVEITGKDGTLYLYEIAANPSVTGIGEKAKWIPPEGKSFEEVPDTLSTVRYTVVAPFKADIYIYNHLGAYVNKLHQEFGYNGEMSDPIRGNSTKYEKIGYFYWNQRSNKGKKVGTGVYIWKILFTFENGHKESITIKSGIRRLPSKKQNVDSHSL